MPEFSSATYSATDANNTSASPDGAPEGMAPSGVNNTIRAHIGATKRFWQRIQSGGGTFGGATNAYTITYTPALAAYVSGERYSFVANADNTGSATLNINGLGAKTLRKITSSGKVALASGDIKNAQPVTVEYDGTDMVMVTPVANLSAGTVTQVSTGSGLTGGPITSSGTLSLDVNGLTEDTSPDRAADFVATYDASASGNKKVKLSNLLIFSKSFVSTDQTITLGGALTLAHGLGVAPKLIRLALVCEIGEHNYSAGDVLENPLIGPGQNTNNSYASLVSDATNINFRYPASGGSIYIANKTTGGGQTITIANWKLRVYAYA